MRKRVLRERSTLAGLGRKHADYGLTDEMYGWVGGSLLATLAEVAGEAWTPELESAWSDAYGAIAALMRMGAQKPDPDRYRQGSSSVI